MGGKSDSMKYDMPAKEDEVKDLTDGIMKIAEMAGITAAVKNLPDKKKIRITLSGKKKALKWVVSQLKKRGGERH
jgi:hypothetical protein